MAISNNVQLEEYRGRLASLVQMDPNDIEAENIKAAFLYSLYKNSNVAGVISADAIDFVLSAIAKGLENAHLAVDGAWAEGNLITARLDSSKRVIVRDLGVRMRRRIPARCTVDLIRQDPPYAGTITVPAYTQWTCNGENFFNRDALILNSGFQRVNVTLYQGQVFEQTVAGINDEFARIRVGDAGFLVSDEDIVVYLNGSQLQIVRRPIWEYPNTYDVVQNLITYRYPVVEDFTLADGSAEIRFGNDFFGTRTQLGDVVLIRYVVTRGTDANVVATQAQSFTINQTNLSTNQVVGLGTSTLGNGANEVPATTYAQVGPLLYANRGKAVDEKGYFAAALEFPGIQDANLQPQRLYAPQDIRYMEYIKTSLLFSDGMNDQRWQEFQDFMTSKCLISSRWLREDPTPLITDITADVFIRSAGDAGRIEAKIRDSLARLFAPRFGLLGLLITRFDISEAIKNADGNINYIRLKLPRDDIYSLSVPPTSHDLTVNSTGGQLLPGFYQWYVSATTSQGETLANLMVSRTNSSGNVQTATGSATLVFNPPRTATNINVYRRNLSVLPNQPVVRVAQLNAANLNIIDYDENEEPLVQFIDTGLPGTSASIPLRNTSGVFYPKLGNIDLNMLISDRIFLTPGAR